MEQSDACKQLTMRSFAIIMACILENVDILQQITNHPSNTMKDRASEVLMKLLNSNESIDSQLNDIETLREKFNTYWKFIRDSPISIPVGVVGSTTRYDAWTDSKIYAQW